MATKKFDGVRSHIMDDVRVLFEGLQYEVLRTGSQELCLPIIGEDNEEGYLVVTFKVPSGSHDGDAYDGYAMAEEYTLKCAEKERKAKESAEKKAKKIALDEAKRKAKAEAKEQKGGE